MKALAIIKRMFDIEEYPSKQKSHTLVKETVAVEHKPDGEFYKDYLKQIYVCKVPFDVVVVHTKPKTRMGTYNPSSRRIRINDGWGNVHDCKETAIHEYAHHIHYTEKGKNKRKEDPHGKQFWQIYRQLMFPAKQKGLYNHLDEL